MIWHYGYWDTFSALIVKIPRRQLTFLLLANSDGLSAPFPTLGRGDVTGSAFAMLFLRMMQEPGVLAAESPAIQTEGVVNAASFLPVISPGSWVTIFGQNFTNEPGRSWNAGDIVDGVLPTTLDGVTVSMDGRLAAISFVSPGQINLQAPDGLFEGPVPIVVAGPTGVSQVDAVVEAVSPALFVAGDPGAVAALHSDGTLVDPANPAKVDEVVSVYGTGFGPTASGIAADIGGVAAVVEYAGLVSAGLYQVNLRIPRGVAGPVPMSIRIANAATQPGLTIAVE